MGRLHSTHTIDEIIVALENNKGLVTLAAKELGIWYQSLYARISKNKRLKDKLIEIREQNLDRAENSLIASIDKGNFDATKFYLTHQGKERGYSEIINIKADVSTDMSIEDFSKLSLEERLELKKLLEKAGNS